jgi:hypothetical protein
VKAAIVGALATVAAATLGAIAVVLQIGKQARAAIDQNRHNESMKLKLQVYQEIVAICRNASDAEVALSSYIRSFSLDIAVSKQMRQIGQKWMVPKARVRDLIDKSHAVSMNAIEIIMLTERWQIIDSRIELMRTAANVASHDIREAFAPYLDLALRVMPQELPGHPQQNPLAWQPPDEAITERLEVLGETLLKALDSLGGYIHDFQIEMQNLLLGELFGQKVPTRKPIDPDAVVVQLDRHKELASHFEANTAWGREKARIEREVRDAYGRTGGK